MNELTGVERHLAAAQRMLQRGLRPTVDLIVGECGGSRTTAQKALAELWENRLPALLAARHYEDDVPVPVREAVGALWREARQEAEAVAQEAFRSANDSLAAREAEMNAVLAGIGAEREQARQRVEALQGQLAELAQRCEQKDAAIEQKDAALAQAASRYQMLEKDRDGWFTAHETAAARVIDLTAALDRAEQLAAARAAEHAEQQAQLRAEAEEMREAQRVAHQQAIDALKAAYVDSEARLRVDLDAARTELAQSRKAAEVAAKQHRDRETALANEIAELKAARRAASVRVIPRRSPISARKRVTHD